MSVITGAAAQIAGKECADLIVGGIGIFAQQGDGIHHETGVAEAALVGTLIGNESHKVGCLCLQAFQRIDLMTIGTDGQSGTRQNGLAIHQHSAKTAVGGVAATLDAEATMIPQEIQQDGIGVGYILALIMGGGLVNFNDFNNAGWFSLPVPFYFGLEFHFDAIVMMILMYVVQAVQTIGDVSSTTMGGFGRECTDAELGGAIKGQGLCGMIGACIGGLPTDPYSQNVGLICTTKVVSRRVFTLVGVVMLLAGICPKFSALMATIPQSVLGGATLTVFAAITMSGIELLNEQKMSYRNKMIVGVALAIGVGIESKPEILQFLPQLARNILGSSLMVSFLVVFLLNILVPDDEEDVKTRLAL